MRFTKQSRSVVGLDIEATSVAASEVRTNAGELVGSGVVSLPPGITSEGEVGDPDALAEALRDLFSEHKLPKSVRLGIASQKVAVRTLKLPLIEDPAELESAVRFQAQEHVPMPLEQAVLDFQVVGHSGGEAGERRTEVVVVAARRDMLTALTGAMRAAGLRPIGIDLSAFGMVRALANGAGTAPPTGPAADQLPAGGPVAGMAPEGFVPATLYCSLGDVTNLAIARGSTCLFARVSAFGIEGIAQLLAERRKLSLEDARGWLVHTGLEDSPDEIEGDREVVGAARDALAEGVAKLADELRLSLEGYGMQEGAAAIEGVVACGPGTTIPGLVERLQRELGLAVRIGRPSALSHLDDITAARLAVSYGLALEE